MGQRTAGKTIRIPGVVPGAYPGLDKTLLTQIVQQVSAAIALFQRPIYIVTGFTEQPCSAGCYNSLTGQGDPDCTVCGGSGKIRVEQSIEINAVTETIDADQLARYPSGYVKEGDILVSITVAEMDRTGVTRETIERARHIRTGEPVFAAADGEVWDYEAVQWIPVRIQTDQLCDAMLGLELILTRTKQGIG